MEQIESGTGRLVPTASAIERGTEVLTAEGDSFSNTFEPGDVLFCKLRPYLAKAWIADFSGRCTNELLVMRPKGPQPRFLRYVCLSKDFIDAVDASTFGSKMPRADWDFIGSMLVPVPSDTTQESIVDYLDRETGRLDALVAAKERFVGLLAEKRRALITRAVTRGLDGCARMMSTGVEWFSEVPIRWRPTKTGRLFRQTKRLGFPDLTVLSVYRDYGVIERASRDDNANRIPDDLEKYQLVEKGDLVINKMKAWQGSLGIAELRGITSPDYVVFNPTHREHPQFLHFLLRNPLLTTVYLSMSNGIRTNQWRLEPDRFANLPLFLPPIKEQEAIVAHIAAETAKLDALRAATERTIALLKERRAVLIAAAVTGRMQIGALVAPEAPTGVY
ncbi:MAG: restriction endonuclease subunit S [Acidobacteriota bacterium]